jgi:hypothetical protein
VRAATRFQDTGATRVSLDFRAIPGPLYDDDYAGSRDARTGAQAFFVGGYFARLARGEGDGAWAVEEVG